jgi:hypothetical protein
MKSSVRETGAGAFGYHLDSSLPISASTAAMTILGIEPIQDSQHLFHVTGSCQGTEMIFRASCCQRLCAQFLRQPVRAQTTTERQ